MLTGYKTYLTAAASVVIAWLSVYLGKADVATALQATEVALLGAFIRHGVSTAAATSLAWLAPWAAPLMLAGLVACSSTGALTPTGQRLAVIGCAIDGLAQPIALPFISGIPTVGGVAASADAALIHPLVTQACTALAASLGTGPAKPVVLP